MTQIWICFATWSVRGRYDTNGQAIGAPDPDTVKYEFTGYEAGLNTGLLYANARFMDPALGSFLSQDPAAEFWSPYSYVGWDPVNRTDPTGRAFGIGALIAAFVIGFAAAAINAAAQGASFGDALLSGLIGGATAVVGATIGSVVLTPALESAISTIASSLAQSTVETVASGILFVSGLGQASYGASQGDYAGVIGLGLGLAVGVVMAKGAQPSKAPGAGGAQGGDGGLKSQRARSRGGT